MYELNVVEYTPALVEQLAIEIAEKLPDFPLSSQAKRMAGDCLAIERIENDERNIEAQKLGREMAKYRADAIAHFKPFKVAADKLHSAIVAREKALLSIIDNGTHHIASVALKFRQEQERIEREKARAAELEMQRKQQAEREQQIAIAQERADALAAEGRDDEAEAVLTAAIETVESKPAMMIIPPPPAATKTAGTAVRKQYTFEVVDLKALVMAAAANWDAFGRFITADEKAIGALVRAQGVEFKAPGIKVSETQKMSFRQG